MVGRGDREEDGAKEWKRKDCDCDSEWEFLSAERLRNRHLWHVSSRRKGETLSHPPL